MKRKYISHQILHFLPPELAYALCFLLISKALRMISSDA